MTIKQCVAKIKHDDPKCVSSTGKSLQVWLNKEEDGREHFTGFCFCCSKLVLDPYGDNPPDVKDIKIKMPEEVQEELDEVRACGYVPDEHRSIMPKYWQHYGVRQLLSEFDGVTPNAIAHPFTQDGKIVRWKVKLLTRKVMWSIGNTQNNDPYGWERAKLAGGSTIYITEGEEDAIALYQILKEMNAGTKYAELDFAVISLSDGCDSVQKCLGPKIDEINQRWSNVVIAFDTDEPGRKAAKIACRLFPNAYIAILPANDANACLRFGHLKQTQEAVMFRAAKPIPSSILSVDNLIDEALEPAKFGVSYPWKRLTDLSFGQRQPELISIGGAEGGGKTTLAHELVAHDINEHKWVTLGAFMEETPADTLKHICGKIANIPYHMPGIEYDRDTFREIAKGLNGYLNLWDRELQSDPVTTWEGMKSAIRAIGDELDLFVLDNLTTLSEGLTASERNDFIGTVCADLDKLKNKFNFQAVVLSHLNAPDKGARQHEAGGKVLQSQFTGSRALARYSDFMIGFERNKQAEDSSCSYIRVLKARKYGKTGALKTYYDTTTGRLMQREWDDELYKDKKSA
ncbi:toprim domain-containing protein [Hafnia alvei]|nr:DnaB-like helicase C-terminal domain-containing protein [Hafnia alvei]MBI0275435.1 toprim domain-containing protein [Hafnia alvei]PNK98572.1 hypothetical protein CEQ28_013750 [Hafnia alvei]